MGLVANWRKRKKLEEAQRDANRMMSNAYDEYFKIIETV